VGVPGPLDPRLEVRIPPATRIPEAARGKLVLHNDPSIDLRKAWPWEHTRSLISSLPPGSVVLLGGPGPELPGVIDLRGRTTLAEAAAIIESATCFIGIESGLTCIAAALEAPTVGLFGRAYIPRPEAVQPYNPQADYVAADTLEDIAPETVLARVQEKLEDRR
jgi:ADP-heptose:LPS heptosyltransferase